MMLNLDVLGRLDEFSETFDIEYYRLNKNRAVATVIKSAQKGKPADRDLIALMRKENFDFKLSKFDLVKLKLSSLLSRVKGLLSGVPGSRGRN